MARCPNFVQIVLVMCLLAVPAHGATAGVSQSTTASASACTATSWIDVRCYGAAGNGSTDDTAAISRALSAALATDQPLFLPHGTYQTHAPPDHRLPDPIGHRLSSDFDGRHPRRKDHRRATGARDPVLRRHADFAERMLLFQRARNPVRQWPQRQLRRGDRPARFFGRTELAKDRSSDRQQCRAPARGRAGSSSTTC